MSKLLYFLPLYTFLLTFTFLIAGCGGGGTDPLPRIPDLKIARDFTGLRNNIVTQAQQEVSRLGIDGMIAYPQDTVYTLDTYTGVSVMAVPIEFDPPLEARAIPTLILFIDTPPGSLIESGKYLLAHEEDPAGNINMSLLDPYTLEEIYRADRVMVENIQEGDLLDPRPKFPLDLGIECEKISENELECKIYISIRIGKSHAVASFRLGNQQPQGPRPRPRPIPDILEMVPGYMSEDAEKFGLANLNPENLSLLSAPDTFVALTPTEDGAFGYMNVGHEPATRALAVRIMTQDGQLSVVDSEDIKLINRPVDYDLQTYGGTERVGIYYNPFGENLIEVHCQCEQAYVAPGGCIRIPFPEPFPPLPIPDDWLLP